MARSASGPLKATLLGLMVLLQGCVMIPYRPSAETKHEVVQVSEPERVRLTVGPRKFLEEMAKDTLKRDKRFSQFDAQTFIDTASPDAEFTLARLLDPATRTRVEPLEIDFLVLLGQPRSETSDTWGDVGIYIGFWGLTKKRQSTTAWAGVIDLHRLQLVEQLNSRATGVDFGAGLFYGLFVISDTEGAVHDDMVTHVVQTIAGAIPSGPVRLVFLAEEQIPTPEEVAAQKQRALPPPPPSWSVEQFPPFAEAPPPNAGQGLLYFYRPEGTGVYTSLVVHMKQAAPAPGSVDVTDLRSGGYYALAVPVGPLEAWIDSDGKRAAVAIEVVSAGTSYVKVKSRLGWRAPRAEMSVVDADEALVAMRDCRLQPSAGESAQETRRLAELGHPEYQIVVAGLYDSGVTYPDGRESLPQDRIESYKWLTIAASHAQWRQSAMKSRTEVASRMERAQIAGAERRASDWIAAHPTGAP